MAEPTEVVGLVRLVGKLASWPTTTSADNEATTAYDSKSHNQKIQPLYGVIYQVVGMA